MQINNKKVFLIFLIFSILISISHMFIGSIINSIDSKEILLENGRKLISKKEISMNKSLQKSEDIIRATKDSKIFTDFLNGSENKSKVEDLFLTITKSNIDFMQFRYLDENGQEVIKVGRLNYNSKASIISENSLQSKSTRDYFIEPKKYKSEKIWFSKLELNKENNKIEVPFRPTIRAALPIFLKNEFKGIIIINYFADDLIEYLIGGVNLHMTLLDELGFIISDSKDSNKNWGFYKKSKYNIANEYPNLASKILTNNSYLTENFISKSLDLPLLDNMYIVLRVEKEVLAEQEKSKMKQELVLSFIYFIISMILSFIVFQILKKVFFDLNTQVENVDRLELATAIANIATWEYNAKTKQVLWSKNINSILENDFDVLYEDFFRMIPKKDRELVLNEFLNSVKGKRDYSIVHQIKIKGYRKKVLEERGRHFYDSFGNHIKSVGCTYDITEKFMADKLKDKIIKQNKKFERLFGKFDESVIASSTDLRGVITYTSQAFCKISGYSKKELIGSPQNIVRHPDSSSDTFRELWKTLKEGNVWQGEIKNKNKDGSYYWVYAVIYPEYDENEKVNGYTAIRQDITSLKELEELNKNLKSSLEVGSFIQQSMLPTKTFIKSCFSDKFVIWEPKDVVGGDIYLLEKLRNEDECLLMVIDCTGHGVPGAFVTMLIKAIERQLVQKILNNKDMEINPGEILQYFNRSLKEILKQEKRNLATNIGFDGAIVYYNKKEKIFKYAGAANTLVYYDKKEIKTIKGDRHSIGYKNIDNNYKFKNHEIKVEKGMKFYLFTDGYIDQIGGEKKQSFSRSRMINIIDQNKNESMDFQKKRLQEELTEYQNEFERVDDVTFLAVEI